MQYVLCIMHCRSRSHTAYVKAKPSASSEMKVKEMIVPWQNRVL